MRRRHQTGQSVHPKHLGPWSGAGDLSELVDGYLTGLRVSREVVVDEGRGCQEGHLPPLQSHLVPLRAPELSASIDDTSSGSLNER